MISTTFSQQKVEEIDKAVEFIIINEIANPELKQLTKNFLKEWKGPFYTSPAAGQHHHNYPGGLLDHTMEVAMIAKNAGRVFSTNLNWDVLIAGAFLHDIGKIWAYEKNILKSGKQSIPKPYKRTEYTKNLGHFGDGLIMFERLCNDNPIPWGLYDQIAHVIASHHGDRPGWGSLVAPNSPEAHIVHHADMISSRVGGDVPNAI